jgi:uncharacterized OB-fold protein
MSTKQETAPSIFAPPATPKPTPETAQFWEGTRAGELRLQRCLDCEHVYFPPRPFCPKCARGRVEWFRASGRGTLYSYVISQSPPPFWGTGPQSCALVTLAEGPRLVSCIVDCPQTPQVLQLDMPLEVMFRKMSDEISLPVFRPVGATAV